MKQKTGRIRYHRIILKLSGEFFGSKGKTLNESTIEYTIDQIIQARRLGVAVGVVVGGGNIMRGRDTDCMDKIDADICGMIGTVINGIVLYSALKKRNQRVKLSSALAVGGIASAYNKFTDLEFYDSCGTVIFAGGTGNPLFTTDTAAALRAAEFGADLLVKGTKVAGVYSSDPNRNKQATFFRKLTYDQSIEKRLKIMDLAAFNICREARIPICVYGFMQARLSDILQGKTVGTIISGG
ncbi:UMP kinase [candidate division WOR-3 bacterium]|nr:UMP kinase [candidate division WOR-3 bacterium]